MHIIGGMLKRSSKAPFSFAGAGADHIFKLITGHPSPSHLLPHLPLTPSLLSDVLSRLLLAHSPTSTALSLFLHSLPLSSPSSLHTLLHILTRARHFELSSNLIQNILLSRPSILSPYSLAILLSRHAKFQSFNSTLHLFDELRDSYTRAGCAFGIDEFNVLLRAFSVQRRMGDARRVFNRYHANFTPNSSTLNTLLLGFKEVGDLMALDLFYNEMVIRGFEPDVVSFNIRIDAYCKKGRFLDALVVFEEIRSKSLSPTLETLTTLVYGAGIARDLSKARQLFDEMFDRGLAVDRGAYNALISSYMRVGDLNGGMAVMDEMAREGIELDDVSYYTVFSGLKKFEDVCKLYGRMVERGFMPRVRTVMLLMKVFCDNKRLDLGLQLWDYIVKKGLCLDCHVLDVLLIGLCSAGRVAESYQCFKQVVQSGRQPLDRTYCLLEGLIKVKDFEKLKELRDMMSRFEDLDT